MPVLSSMYRLTKRTVSGPRAWIGLSLYATVLALEFVGVWVSIQFIDWTKTFYDALEQLDVAQAVAQIWVFAALVAMSASAYLTGDWLRKRLLFIWRARLTAQALDGWLCDGAHWHLRPGLSVEAVDNPDQRVAEDCRNFIRLLLLESIDLITNIVALFSYVAILWGLSDFALNLALMGTDISIPRYMVWLAFIYVALSSGITHLLGRPLKSLVFRQERREADFRHALIQLRESATEVAQSRGEPAERRRLDTRFEAIRGNWHRLIGREFILGLFTRPYFHSVLRLPLFFALPAYFAGAVTFGGLMQLSAAFSRVTTTLSWFIFSYRNLAEFAAVAQRLDGLFANCDCPSPMPGAPRSIERETTQDGALHVSGLTLYTPQGRALDRVPDITIKPGERIWIRGPSGQGKSTLLAALSGLWRYGAGRIGRPEASIMFLPQKPHVSPEGLAVAACYPHDPAKVPPARLHKVLTTLGLGHRLSQMAVHGPEAVEGLSMGERQRLALARILISRPDWIVLDEATSALDVRAEADMLRMIRRELPDTTILCVSHRQPLALSPYRTWTIGAEETPERRIA